MTTTRAALLLGLALSACSGLSLRPGRGAEAPPQHTLPLRRLRLYASGVGYFERSGVLQGPRDSLPVPASHLDDALASLVLLSPRKNLQNVSFPSRVSPAVARARAGLSTTEDEALSFDRLLASLRGELVEARAHGREVSGRIVEVVAVGPDHPTYVHRAAKLRENYVEPETLHVIVLSDDGELLRFEAGELSAVRARDPAVIARLEAAVGARLALRSKRGEALTIDAAAHEEVALGYLAEAPIWRPSYRLILDGSGARGAHLQAWALVHNDTDELWHGVLLELSNGEPESLLFPLSAPRYERRALRTPERALSSVPQLSTTTADAMWGDFSDYTGESVESLGTIGVGLGTIGSGYGRGGGGFASVRDETTSVSREPKPRGSTLVVLGDLTRLPPEETTRVHALSSFRAESPFDLAPHHSAMVPFIDERIATRSLVWFASPSAAAERGLAIRNDSHNALPTGPLSVFGEGGFVGQAELEGLKPGERSFARIGRDADTDLTVLGETLGVDEKRLSYEHGALHVHFVKSRAVGMRIGSRNASARQVYVAFDLVTNATVEGADRLDYDGAGEQALAIFDLPPGAVRSVTVTTREGLSLAHPLAELSSDELTRLAALSTFPESERSVVRAAVAVARSAEGARAEEEELAAQIAAAEEDVSRLRSHAQSLEKSESGEAQGELVRSILERQGKLRALRTESRTLAAERNRREAALGLALTALAPAATPGG